MLSNLKATTLRRVRWWLVLLPVILIPIVFGFTVLIFENLVGDKPSIVLDSNSGAQTLAWSPDGNMLAIGTRDGTIKIWDTNTWQLLTTSRNHTGSVASLAWSPDGSKIASISEMIKIWTISTNQQISLDVPNYMSAVKWNRDGGILAGFGNLPGIQLWSTTNFEVLNTIPGFNLVWGLNGNHLAVATQQGQIEVFDLASGEIILTLRGHTDQIYSIAWNPNESLIASASADADVRVWDPNIGTLYTTLNHPFKVLSVVWSPDGELLASVSGDESFTTMGGNRKIFLWDVDSSQQMYVLEVEPEMLLDPISLVWNPSDHRLLAAFGRSDPDLREWLGKIWIWDTQNGQLLNEIEYPVPLVSIEWSPNADMLAAIGTDGGVQIWNALDLAQ